MNWNRIAADLIFLLGAAIFFLHWHYMGKTGRQFFVAVDFNRAKRPWLFDVMRWLNLIPVAIFVALIVRNVVATQF